MITRTPHLDLSYEETPRRMVSLVPSITESLFALGLGGCVVGATDYCVHPAPLLRDVPRVGGPKNARLADILALKPDLVLANQEENSPGMVQALSDAGLTVWLTFPKTVYQAMEDLWKMVEVLRARQGRQAVQAINTTLDWASAAENAPFRYFCPIWRGEDEHGVWWMTFNGDTYSSDLLRLMGGVNAFESRVRRYPLEADLGRGCAEPAGERDTRYPCVTVEEVRAAQPEAILLPDEPFAFQEEHVHELKTLLPNSPAVLQERLIGLDGSLITWPGVRLMQALADLPALLT